MTLIPIFFYWFIGAVMHHTEGHYDVLAGRFTIFFLITVAFICWRPIAGTFPLRYRSKLWNLALAVSVALASYTLFRKPLMIYAMNVSPASEIFRALTGCSLVCAV